MYFNVRNFANFSLIREKHSFPEFAKLNFHEKKLPQFAKLSLYKKVFISLVHLEIKYRNYQFYLRIA